MTTDDDEALQSLLRWAGRRPMPPDAASDAVYQSTHRAWLAQVRRRRRFRLGSALGVAAVALAIAGWGVFRMYPHQVLATVRPGQAVRIAHTLWHPFAGRYEGRLYEGDTLQTGNEGAVLQRSEGNEVDVSPHSHLAFTAANLLQLGRGGLYLTTHGARQVRNLMVGTDLGTIEHLGTRFLAERQDERLLVAVRDGRVVLHTVQHQAIELQQGEAASVSPQGQVRRWSLAAFDSTWDWADGLAAPLVIDGQSVYAVLSGIAERAGLALRFSNPQAETEARSLALHGAPLTLPPREALRAVLATTSLTGSGQGREILVSSR